MGLHARCRGAAALIAWTRLGMEATHGQGMQSSCLLLCPDVCGLLERRSDSLTEHWTPVAFSESTESQRASGNDEKDSSSIEKTDVQEIGGAEVFCSGSLF